MEIIALVLAVVAIIQTIGLRDRIKRLEKTPPAPTAVSAVTTEVREVAVRLPGEPLPAVDPGLASYIKDQIARGATRSEVETKLMAAGWRATAIAEAFAALAAAPLSYGTVVVAPPSTAGSAERFFAWWREEWLLKLGALLLLMALGWFTTYAFMNNWIGENGRVALGLVIGAVFLSLGAARIKVHAASGSVFLVLGSTTILLTTFAAQVAYEMFPPVVALTVMFFSAAFVAVVSVMYERKALATASLLLAALAPILTNAPEPSYIGLFSYLFVIMLGTVGVAAALAHRSLVVVGLAIVALYSLPHFGTSHVEIPTLLLFAFAFTALFFIAHSGGILRTGVTRPTADLVAAVGNGLLLTFWIISTAPAVWQSLFFSTWCVLFLTGAFVVFRLTGRRDAFLVYGVVAVGLLAAATATELSGPALTIAYTAEVAALVILLYAMTRSAETASRAALLFIVPTLMALPSLEPYRWQGGVPAGDLSVLLTLIVAVAGTGVLAFIEARRSVEGPSHAQLQKLGGVLTIVGSFLAYALLWRVLQVMLPETLALLTTLTVYTVIGIAAYIKGSRDNHYVVRIYGALLIGFVVARLLLVDIWSLDTPGRIVTFGSIGVLLISTAFISRRRL